FALFVLGIYALGIRVQILPLTSLCLISAAVLTAPWALLLNGAGVVLMCFLRYRRGEKHDGGKAWGIVLRNRPLRGLLERDGGGNPWILLVIRLAPIFPVGSVSSLYGGLKYPLTPFLALSLGGLLPRILAACFIGTSVFDPLSPALLTPLILILLVTGCVLLFWKSLINLCGNSNGCKI
ncbi:MAG: hypothetical protein FWG82_06500, partial [Oscillospiraceae bacterium]|nr:hypothetical protein [Oscillospiraceae bacterium]